MRSTATGYEGALDAVFSRAQVLTGVGMLTGSVAGGYVAQVTNLGVPFVLRAGVLVVMFGVAFVLMRDVGFTPTRRGRPLAEMRASSSDSLEYGMRVPSVR